MPNLDFSILAKRPRRIACGVITVLSLTTSLLSHAVEMLEHISEDTAPPPTADQVPVDDRRIIYRVICAPDGEQLPDCEQPLQDRESAPPPASSPESAKSTSVAAEDAAEQPVSTKRKSAKKTGSGKKAKAESKAKRKKTRK